MERRELREEDPLGLHTNLLIMVFYAVTSLCMVRSSGNTIIMVTSVSMEGDLVGHDTDSSSFVYGTLSFTDKLSNGLLILLVAGMQQSACPAYDPEGLSTNQCSLLFRNVMGLSSAAPALLGAIVALFVSTSKSV